MKYDQAELGGVAMNSVDNTGQRDDIIGLTSLV